MIVSLYILIVNYSVLKPKNYLYLVDKMEPKDYNIGDKPNIFVVDPHTGDLTHLSSAPSSVPGLVSSAPSVFPSAGVQLPVYSISSSQPLIL